MFAIAHFQPPHEQLERRGNHLQKFVVTQAKIDARDGPEFSGGSFQLLAASF